MKLLFYKIFEYTYKVIESVECNAQASRELKNVRKHANDLITLKSLKINASEQ